MDPDILDDPGFWRYLSLAHYRSFIRWRERGAFADGKFELYVDGRTATECVLTRMYDRGASAIGDLVDRGCCGVMDAASEMNPENRQRVDWLFDNGEYDLPNAQRPGCHRGGTTYGSVYDRMRPDKPAPQPLAPDPPLPVELRVQYRHRDRRQPALRPGED